MNKLFSILLIKVAAKFPNLSDCKGCTTADVIDVASHGKSIIENHTKITDRSRRCNRGAIDIHIIKIDSLDEARSNMQNFRLIRGG